MSLLKTGLGSETLEGLFSIYENVLGPSDSS